MTNKIVERILAGSGMADLLDILAKRLAPTDLQSLLLAVFRRRAAAQTPARVLDQYAANRFVQPAVVPQQARVALDHLALALATPAFEALDLAPVCPLGTSAVLGPLDQNRIVTTIRNTEVVSDSTNVLALEAALRRRAARHDPAAPPLVQLCSSHRLLRAQHFPDRPEFRAHFQIFALCTAGRDQGNAQFETAALSAQVGTYLAVLAALPQIGYLRPTARIAFTDLVGDSYRAALEESVITPLAARFPAAGWAWEPDRQGGRGYYERVCFHVYARTSAGVEYELGDGGFTPWTQQLLSDRKERLLISGLSTERIASFFGNAASQDGA